jgi:ferredoxin-NADP reductase
MQDDIELCISIKEPPSFTYFMNENIQVGGKMKVKGPYGGFVLHENPEAINLIAAGTGIAPIMGMIRDLALNQANVPLRLFYGYRNSSQHYYAEELKQLVEKNGNLSMLTIASREGPNPGHVQKLLEEFDFTGNKELEDTYICGPPKMVDHAKEIMMQKGFPKTRIYVEKYD